VVFPSLLLIGLAGAPDTVPADPCVARASARAGAIEAFVVVPAMRARDTVVTAQVCVVPRTEAGGQRAKIGSYHGELRFDSTNARVLRVEKPAGGVRVENARIAGAVRFAGAEPLGFQAGQLLSVVLRVAKPGMRPVVRLTMIELNATDGTSLMKQLVTSAAKSP
jgi:hypothetical protein